LYFRFPGHSCTSDFAVSSAFSGGCSLCIIIFFCSLFSLDLYYPFMLIAWVLMFSRASDCLCVWFFFFFPLLGERDAEILWHLGCCPVLPFIGEWRIRSHLSWTA
jgi:hypothetical protein